MSLIVCPPGPLKLLSVVQISSKLDPWSFSYCDLFYQWILEQEELKGVWVKKTKKKLWTFGPSNINENWYIASL